MTDKESEDFSNVRYRYASNGNNSRSESPNTASSTWSSTSSDNHHHQPLNDEDHHDQQHPRTPPARPKRFTAAATARMARLRGRREPLLDQHFRVRRTSDTGRRVVLPGIPQHSPDWAVDLHDFFNLAILVPVVTLNVVNWNWDILWKVIWPGTGGRSNNRLDLPDAWTGEYFHQFFLLTVFYFCVDLIWIIVQPRCVKSPLTIIQHHIATLLYIYLPFREPQVRWVMGACMMVEINTWFLIARRVFNRQNFPPTVIDLSCMSIRVKVISLLFYVSWIGIRCILYPYLMPRVYDCWQQKSQHVGTPWNLVFLSVPLHALFCLLNLKWSYDLLMSKLRYWRRKRQGLSTSDHHVSKGL